VRLMMMMVAFLGFGVVGLGAPSADAMAGNCSELKGKRKQNCLKGKGKGQKGKGQKGQGKKKPNAFRPSGLAKGLGMLDASNPLSNPRYYTPKPKKIGVQRVDRLSREVAKIDAAVNLGKYATDLQAQGKVAEAAQVAAVLAPVMVGLGSSVDTISKDVIKLAKNPKEAVGNDIIKIPQAAIALGSLAKDVPGLAKDLASLTVEVGAIAKLGASQVPDAINAIPENARGVLEQMD